MGVFTISFQVGATSQLSMEEANEFIQDFLSQTEEIDGPGIFLNNITAALPMFVPGAGIAIGIYSGWSTGFGFAAIITMAPALAEIEPLAVLYYSSYGIMELVSYSIAMSRSFLVVFYLVKKANPKSLIRPSLFEIAIVVGLLFAAGFLEEYIIQISQEATPGL